MDKINLDNTLKGMETSLTEVKKFIAPVITELKEYQENSVTIDTLKTRNTNIKESVTNYLELGIAKYKSDKISNKMVLNFLFMTLKTELATDAKDYTKSVISVLEWYYTNSNILIKKEVVSFNNLKALKNLKSFYSNKAIKDLMSNKSLSTNELYKSALEAILKEAHDLKTRFGVLSGISETELKAVTDATKLITVKNAKIVFNHALISDISEIAKFKEVTQKYIIVA